MALRVPKSTLSKRVADLEAHLGVRLIERSTRTLRATQEGEVLAARADRLLGEAEDIRRALGESGGTPRGHLRLAVPQSFGNVMLGAIAADFRKLHPEVTLEVHFLDRAPDLLEEGFDGCIRFGPLEDSSQVARRLLHGQAMLVGIPLICREQFPLVRLYRVVVSRASYHSSVCDCRFGKYGREFLSLSCSSGVLFQG